MASRLRIQPVAIVLIVVAVVLVVVGIIYLTQTADNLPGFIPGKLSDRQLALGECGTPKAKSPTLCYEANHYTKRGIAALGLAAVVLIGAWYTSGLRRSAESRV
jgi:hypothetical protein